MTSRNLFSKLMKEDLKRRLWAIGFSVLALFFAMPMAAAMGIGAIGNQYKEWLISGTGYENITPEMLQQTKILRLAGTILGFENAVLFMVIGIAAMILGLTGFLYLHSKKQIDFYNSLPVKRETLFAVKFLDGFLIIASAYIINMFTAFGIFCGNGVATGEIVEMMFASFVVNMIGFLLLYVVMVIAVLLTGNLFISILGAGVLYGYMPAISVLIETLKSLFYVTQGRGSTAYWLAEYGSPIGYFGKMVNAGLDVFHTDQFYDDIDFGYSGIQMSLQNTADSGANLLKYCVIGLTVAVVLAVIALFLYKIRPSESAGKAMAFKKTQAPIKILILVPMTIVTTVFLWSIYYSIVWAAVGFILGLVLSSCIIEIIYHFDFAKLFANPVQTVISGVLAIIVIGLFWTDAFGYDSYIPDEKNFESATINMNLDGDIDYGLPYLDGDSYRWRYIDASDYADANMKLTDYTAVRELAEKAVENAKQQRSRKLNGDRDSSYSYPHTYKTYDGYMIYVQAGYRQKNGKTVYRSYSISRAALGSTLDEIYAMKEYKDGTYPVMSYKTENIMGIYWLSDSKISEVNADDALRAEILAAYQEELSGLTINERAVEAPVAALRFLTKAEDEYLHTISAQRGYTSSGFRMDDMNAVNFFPVYPSFTKTIALLKQAGVDVTAKLTADDVEQIKIMYPVEYEISANGADAKTTDTAEEDMVASAIDGNSDVVMMETTAVRGDYDSSYKMFTIVNDGSEENKAKINEILSYSVSSNFLERNHLCTYESGIEIYVYIKPDSAFSSGNGTVDERIYRILGEEVPDCIERVLNYSKIDVKSISSGIGVLESD